MTIGNGGTTGRPNILFIIADQLRADHLGFGGNNTVRTPNLDALAARSTVFTEATVANPTCMPNRASLMTGRWPSVHGTRCNGITLDPVARTLPRVLRGEGYRTIGVGKLHHQNMGWEFEPHQQAEIAAVAPLLVEARATDAREPGFAPGWDQWENRDAHDERFIELPADYYGYNHVDLVIGHGDRPGGHYVHWARERGIDPAAVGGPENSSSAYSGWEQVYQTAVPAELHPSSYVGEKAIEQLKDAAGQDQPFFMFVSFPDPHHPFSPPQGYADLYDPDAIELPIGFSQDHSRSPEHVRRMIEHRGEPNIDPTMTWAATEEQYRHAAAAQYGLITLMDEHIGRILDELERQGLADDTIIVFTADHGDLFGDHGLMLKHFVHYRAVTNVPLLIHVPGGIGRQSDALVSSTDLAPTLLELAGAPSYRGIQGRSLSPLLEGRTDMHRERLLVEEEQPFGLDGLPGPVRMRTVITADGRLTCYFGNGMTELYDHRSDPDELDNLAGNPEHRELEQRLMQAMLEEMAAVADEGTAPTAAA
ncbi:sulfatase [Arthrobacter sp. AZCC_0090]|uniref:sulfatase family protein n=1 Tax=Arthrobacter sp. AZCC_0090 TaxID=2735881 RepID=UPI0016141A2A|nr:sulfatase-like hydrolase/transferase [Arthrobacter sp. AZCC_0090]MBB6404073.1 arylsulfatase A-like enzyme [Arthrobacter sp. AZCC_0090]